MFWLCQVIFSGGREIRCVRLTSTKKTNRPYSYAVCFTVKKHIHVLYDFIKDFYGSIIYSGVIFLVMLKTHSPKIDHLKAYMQDINGRIYEQH